MRSPWQAPAVESSPILGRKPGVPVARAAVPHGQGKTMRSAGSFEHMHPGPMTVQQTVQPYAASSSPHFHPPPAEGPSAAWLAGFRAAQDWRVPVPCATASNGEVQGLSYGRHLQASHFEAGSLGWNPVPPFAVAGKGASQHLPAPAEMDRPVIPRYGSEAPANAFPEELYSLWEDTRSFSAEDLQALMSRPMPPLPARLGPQAHVSGVQALLGHGALSGFGSASSSSSAAERKLPPVMPEASRSSEVSSVPGTEELPPSVGSVGHPTSCGLPCKYAKKARGCKDGSLCERCHICPWKPKHK